MGSLHRWLVMLAGFALAVILILLVFDVRAQQAQPVRTVQLTEQEIAATIEMLDLACKAGGLRVCRNALVIVDKLQSAPPPKSE